MKTSRIVPIFCLFTGCLIAVLWLMLLFTGQVAELTSAPLEISLHIASELLLAGLLITTGVLCLRDHRQRFILYAFSSGMLLYSTLNAAGYYAQLGVWPAAAMLLAIGIIGVLLLIRTKDW